MFSFLSSSPSYSFQEFTKCLPAIELTRTLIDRLKQEGGQKIIADLPSEGQGCRRNVFVDIFKSVKDVEAIHHKGLFPNITGERIRVSYLEDGTFRSDFISREDFN